MADYPVAHSLGRIDIVTLNHTPALSRDVNNDLAAVQSAWPEFEGMFDSLQGRKMMGLIYNEFYRMATIRLERDRDNTPALDETLIPGGKYLRLRLRGDAPAVYEKIAPAFEELFRRADHDAERPHIEHYRREGEVDCLVPIITNNQAS
ncbi:effector binding domain-containing protein [Jonesia quinghaiensis]|uniref:effector binding domain-containing protein n=1 Tax=Jonesia quinghaiensis TaxID=262806 RepID=UPI0004913011|nr:GyrI-like domain-containing protein [Jonesia quinghaiensis]